MSSITSVQTIGQAVNQLDNLQHLDNSGIRQQTLSYQNSLTVDDGTSKQVGISIIVDDSKTKVAETSVTQKLIEGITQVDSDYQSIIGKLNAWPDFDGYLAKRGVSKKEQLEPSVGITHISNIDDIQKASENSTPISNQELLEEKSNKVEALQKEQQAYYSAGIEYSQDSTLWSMNSTFWLSKIKILTSAVSQVSSGLKTLFMSQ